MITTEEHRQKVMKRYQWYKDQGICPMCKWRPHAPGHVRCNACMKSKNKKAPEIQFKLRNEPSRYDLIMDDLENGKDYKAIATTYKTTISTIKVYDLVRKNELPVYDPELENIPESDRPIIDLYISGYGIVKIARAKHMSNEEVSWELEQAGITIRGTRHIHIPSDSELREISEQYAKGADISKLAKHYRMSSYRIVRYMDKLGIQRPWHHDGLTDDDWSNLAAMYQNGMMIKDLCKIIHRSPSTISVRFKMMGVPIRSREERSREIAKKCWDKRRREKYEQSKTPRNDAEPDREKRNDACGLQPSAED